LNHFIFSAFHHIFVFIELLLFILAKFFLLIKFVATTVLDVNDWKKILDLSR
jgi:hypothetical protein